MRFYSLELAGETILDIRCFPFLALLATMMIVPRYLQADTVVTGASTPQITVVDLMPKSLSGETEGDAEPNIAVNPANPLQIAASAFTREPMRRADRAPIFVSTDGGESWSLRSIVPSPQITCDVTLRFGSSCDVLYVSALRNETDCYKKQELMICETGAYATTRLMREVFKNRNYIDQPYIAVMTVASKDHVFVGDCDFNYPSGQAVIDRSLDAAHASFTPVPIEYQPKAIDWSEVRPAIAEDGKVVYAAFNRVTSLSDDGTPLISDVVVVRDDEGGAAPSPFSSLDDPEGGYGLRVVKQRVFAWNKCLGGDRLGDDLAIAVNPADKNKVYLVWSDWVSDRVSLHLKYSTDGGQSWSDNKRDVPDAKNPGLAVTAKGTVGFLYQQVVKTPEGDTWMTQFERTTDDFKSAPNPVTLAKFPVNEFSPTCGEVFLGDYLHLMAADNNFYGIFSSSNKPDRSRFPCGVNFQRRKNFNTMKLLDLQGKEVTPSIDPFFFKVTES